MAETTRIEWTDATWNPITGCSLVSEGCRHCYAATLAATRLKHHPSRAGLARINAAGEAKFTGEVRFNEQWLDQPLRWSRPRRIFVCAHGDLFHESVPDGWIMRVLNVMAHCPAHTFQVLTKRPERARVFFDKWADLSGENHGEFRNARGPDAVRDAHKSGRGQLFAAMLDAMGDPPPGAAYPSFDWEAGMMRWGTDPFPNIWLGTSIEDQGTADARIPHLLAARAAVRFVSAEPLLAPVNIMDAQDGMFDFLRGFDARGRGKHYAPLDWVIVGGESGPGARVWPGFEAAARSLRDQCRRAGVLFFMKQMAGPRKSAMPPIPNDLMVREMPGDPNG
jgi:protein gp37